MTKQLSEARTVWVKVMPHGNQWLLYETKCYRTKEQAIHAGGILLPFKYIELKEEAAQ